IEYPPPSRPLPSLLPPPGEAAGAPGTGKEMTDPERTLPHVTLNFAMSLDGKISTAARGRFRFTSGRDLRVMDEIRARSDAVLIGGATLRAEDPPLQVRDARLREGRILAGH